MYKEALGRGENRNHLLGADVTMADAAPPPAVGKLTTAARAAKVGRSSGWVSSLVLAISKHAEAPTSSSSTPLTRPAAAAGPATTPHVAAAGSVAQGSDAAAASSAGPGGKETTIQLATVTITATAAAAAPPVHVEGMCLGVGMEPTAA